MFRLLVLSTFASVVLGGVPILRSPRPQLDGRIVGGDKVVIESYPYQLSLQVYGFHRCSASIVSDTVAITAAHCTDGLFAHELTVRAGNSFIEPYVGGQQIPVSKIHQHPDYDNFNLDYDISVLILRNAIEFGPEAQPIPLPEEHLDVPGGTVSVVSGWGALREGGSLPYQLRAVKVPVIDIETCREAYGASSITDRMICAGIPEGGKGTCEGDSGSPLVALSFDDLKHRLVGVVSWGYGCARPNYPGVYASVPNLRGFIKEVAGL